jgi:uncharacterized membrane protein YcgQ (UPF0703/DUF1980 family)
MKLFSSIYELVCGVNADYPEYREQLFRSVGLLTIVTAFIICFLFYIFLGRWKMIWFNNIHWTITILFSAVAGFLLAFLAAKSSLQVVDGYLIRFAFANGIFGALVFIVFSFLLKSFSVFSKRTPF